MMAVGFPVALRGPSGVNDLVIVRFIRRFIRRFHLIRLLHVGTGLQTTRYTRHGIQHSWYGIIR